MSNEFYKAQKMSLYLKIHEFLMKVRWTRDIRNYVDYRREDVIRCNGEVPFNELIKITTAILKYGISKEVNAIEELRSFLGIWYDFLLSQESEFFGRTLYELKHPQYDYDTKKKKNNHQK